MTRDELEAIRERLNAAKAQSLPAGMRIVALHLVREGQEDKPVVYGASEEFSRFMIESRRDVEELLEVVEAIVAGREKP